MITALFFGSVSRFYIKNTDSWIIPTKKGDFWAEERTSGRINPKFWINTPKSNHPGQDMALDSRP
jgi:hypothetical protein